ncbi:MAG: sigma-54-dependent Fis family transcriptional regulator [Myxococcales bacterium FL481]|nr:MAG: sigma-54-dependent Fis family transcriptional regulator [Myxococcales bacterium FL481]
MTPAVLTVDDDANLRFTLGEILREQGWRPIEAADASEALTHLDEADVVLSDLAMPGRDGLALLEQIRTRRHDLPVILLTAHGSERVAVDAIKRGAYDYLTKPFDLDELVHTVARAVEVAQLRRDDARHRMQSSLGRLIVGESRALRSVLDAAIRLAPRHVPVLIRGETGTGKELVAGLLHSEGPRAKHPLVRINCAAIPPQLAEAELFGFRKGAFTGAVADHRGHFRRAHRGTLVIDEIGELELSVQAKLLRVLQEGEVQPLGADSVEHVDVRVVACTHRDLRADAAAGRFREDLFFRLAVVELEVPPLRDRRADIAPLAQHFARRIQESDGDELVALDSAALARLRAHDWPGNVRELENCIARWVALGVDRPLEIPGAQARDIDPPTDTGTLRQRVAAFERELLRQAVQATSGNHSAAARALGLSRVTLIDKLKRHGLFRRRQE